MTARHAPEQTTADRHCVVCGRIGGSAFTQSLRLAGYDIPRGTIGYAHASCVRRAALAKAEAA